MELVGVRNQNKVLPTVCDCLPERAERTENRSNANIFIVKINLIEFVTEF